MSTKLKPGRYDCYDRLADDEPYFVLRAKDPLAPALVRLWAALRESEFGPTDKFEEAKKCADDMRRWADDHDIKSLGHNIVDYYD